MNDLHIRFPGQRNHEKVQHVIRKHWIVHVLALLKFIVIAILPVSIVFWLVTDNTVNPLFFGGGYSLVLSFLCFYLAFAMQYFYVQWTNEELDLLIITNMRIMDITQISFLKRDVAEAPITQIQDVKGRIEGFFGTLLHYGTLKLSTANHMTIFELDTVPDPQSYSMKILDFIQNTIRNSHRKKSINNDFIIPMEKVKASGDLDILESRNNLRQKLLSRISNLFQK